MFKKSIFPIAFLSFVAFGSACDKASTKSESKEKVAETPAKKVTETPTTPKQKPAAVDTEATGNSLKDAGGKYAIDSSHTQVVFRVNHAGASNQYGQFTRVEGSFSIDASNIGASEISLKIPAGSIFTADKKRDEHLRGPDFFDAKQFPDVTFKSTKVTANGAKKYSVDGDIMIHGVTKSVTISLEHGGSAADPEMMGGKFRTGFNGTFTIKRSDFGINYMPGALGDEITLLLALEGTRE